MCSDRWNICGQRHNCCVSDAGHVHHQLGYTMYVQRFDELQQYGKRIKIGEKSSIGDRVLKGILYTENESVTFIKSMRNVAQLLCHVQRAERCSVISILMRKATEPIQNVRLSQRRLDNDII